MTANKDQRKVFLLSAFLLFVGSVITFIAGFYLVIEEENLLIGSFWILVTLIAIYACKENLKAGKNDSDLRGGSRKRNNSRK